MQEAQSWMKSDGWKVVKTRSQDRYRKAKKYLEKTVKTMSDFLVEFDRMQEKFQHLARSLQVGISGGKTEKIKEEMKKWPEEIETYVEVVLASLAEEWGAAEETFTDSYVLELVSVKNHLDAVLGKGDRSRSTPCSVQALQKAIGDFDAAQDSDKTFSLLNIIGNVLREMFKELDWAHMSLKVEERMILADHMIVQQLLGNKYLRDMAELLRREAQAVLERYAQAIQEKDITNRYTLNGRHAPDLFHKCSQLRVEVTVRTYQANMDNELAQFWHGHNLDPEGKMKREILALQVTFPDEKYKARFLFELWFDAVHDRFISYESISMNKEIYPAHGTVTKNYEYTSLEDFLEHIGQKVFFVEVDIAKHLKEVAVRGSPVLGMLKKAA